MGWESDPASEVKITLVDGEGNRQIYTKTVGELRQECANANGGMIPPFGDDDDDDDDAPVLTDTDPPSPIQLGVDTTLEADGFYHILLNGSNFDPGMEMHVSLGSGTFIYNQWQYLTSTQADLKIGPGFSSTLTAEIFFVSYESGSPQPSNSLFLTIIPDPSTSGDDDDDDDFGGSSGDDDDDDGEDSVSPPPGDDDDDDSENITAELSLKKDVLRPGKSLVISLVSKPNASCEVRLSNGKKAGPTIVETASTGKTVAYDLPASKMTTKAPIPCQLDETGATTVKVRIPADARPATLSVQALVDDGAAMSNVATAKIKKAKNIRGKTKQDLKDLYKKKKAAMKSKQKKGKPIPEKLATLINTLRASIRFKVFR